MTDKIENQVRYSLISLQVLTYHFLLDARSIDVLFW